MRYIQLADVRRAGSLETEYIHICRFNNSTAWNGSISNNLLNAGYFGHVVTVLNCPAAFQVSNVRFPKDVDGRFKGFCYAEVDDMESLKTALSLNDEVKCETEKNAMTRNHQQILQVTLRIHITCQVALGICTGIYHSCSVPCWVRPGPKTGDHFCIRDHHFRLALLSAIVLTDVKSALTGEFPRFYTLQADSTTLGYFR